MKKSHYYKIIYSKTSNVVYNSYDPGSNHSCFYAMQQQNLENKFIDIYCYNNLENLEYWISVLDSLGFNSSVSLQDIVGGETDYKILRIDCNSLKTKQAVLFYCVFFRPFCSSEKLTIIPNYKKLREKLPEKYTNFDCLYMSCFYHEHPYNEMCNHWIFSCMYSSLYKMEKSISNLLNEKINSKLSDAGFRNMSVNFTGPSNKEFVKIIDNTMKCII
jgi:hypothetical protein